MDESENFVSTLRLWLNYMRLLEQSQKNRTDHKFGGKEASLIDCDIYENTLGSNGSSC